MIKEPTQLTLRAKFPRPTAAQIAAFKDVPTGFVCDAMDGVGGMETAISPLFDAHIAGCTVVVDNCSGGIGFVTDSPMRDLVGIQDVGLAAWCNGLNPNSPYANGPGCVGFDASVGGQLVRGGDIIVADIDGVVVVPHARIDRVIAKLDAVRAAETAMEAKVKSEFSEHSRIIQMLTDGRAVMED
ncbi:MAG: RraA family protein [Octadecabacter sp.]|jgi:4-hydroxy-4-methyl-2-oxoglutarate aldolase